MWVDAMGREHTRRCQNVSLVEKNLQNLAPLDTNIYEPSALPECVKTGPAEYTNGSNPRIVTTGRDASRDSLPDVTEEYY